MDDLDESSGEEPARQDDSSNPQSNVIVSETTNQNPGIEEKHAHVDPTAATVEHDPDDFDKAPSLHPIPSSTIPIPDRHDGTVLGMMKWYLILCLAGTGMMEGGLIIISTGQIKTLWEAGYPACWIPDSNVLCPNLIQCDGLFPNTPSNLTENAGFCTGPPVGTYPSRVLCNSNVLNSISYSEFAGIMVGMLTFGYLGDVIGRHKGSLLASIAQLIGITIMVFFSSPNGSLETLFLVWSIFYAIFGLGQGGEYPFSGASAVENYGPTVLSNTDFQGDKEAEDMAHKSIVRGHRKRRGENIGMVFSMQGIGSVIGSLLILMLIYFARNTSPQCSTSGYNEMGYNPDALEGAWRVFYFIGFLVILMSFMHRLFFAEENEAFAHARRKQEARDEVHQRSLFHMLKLYWPRLLGTAGSWMCWDITFYGNKLYSGPIFAAIKNDGSLLSTNGYITLTNVVALVGYYSCCYFIDRMKMGRLKTLIFGFSGIALFFFLAAGFYDTLMDKAPGALLFLYISANCIAMYVNVGTFVVAAESFPTELRSTFHGLSAFSGKIGALLSTIVFGYVSIRTIFFITAVAAVIGGIFSVFFVADMTDVVLAEHDVQLELYVQDKLSEYKGQLNLPEHLSLFEKLLDTWRGTRREYDPEFLFKYEILKKTKLEGGA